MQLRQVRSDVRAKIRVTARAGRCRVQERANGKAPAILRRQVRQDHGGCHLLVEFEHLVFQGGVGGAECGKFSIQFKLEPDPLCFIYPHVLEIIFQPCDLVALGLKQSIQQLAQFFIIGARR